MRKNAYPQINLAPQVLINCHGGGTCDGKQQMLYKHFLISLPPISLALVYVVSYSDCVWLIITTK